MVDVPHASEWTSRPKRGVTQNCLSYGDQGYIESSGDFGQFIREARLPIVYDASLACFTRTHSRQEAAVLVIQLRSPDTIGSSQQIQLVCTDVRFGKIARRQILWFSSKSLVVITVRTPTPNRLPYVTDCLTFRALHHCLLFMFMWKRIEEREIPQNPRSDKRGLG